MKDSDILKQAKLELPKCSGICGAISKAVETLYPERNPSRPEARERASSLKNWIRSMLKGHCWLSGWLDYYKHTTKDDPFYGSITYWEKMRATRQAWLDWMIEQCEKAEQDAEKELKSVEAGEAASQTKVLPKPTD